MSQATLGGRAIARASLQLPRWGLGWADVELTEAEALTGSQTLVIADASHTMTVVSGGVTDAGRARYRLVMGHGGWGREIPKKAYSNDGGVALATVLRDAATEVGEAVGSLPDSKLGPHYARAAGPASNVLHLHRAESWHVDAAGVTQFTPWPEATYTGSGTRTQVDPAANVIELAVDEIANLAPGVVVDGRTPATDVEIAIDAKRLIVRVYAGTKPSRRITAIRRIIEALQPSLKYRGVYEFRVVTQSGNRLNLQPVRAASGMPDLARVPVRGPAGFKAQVTPGELVLVAFADADPSRPQVIAHDNPDSPGWMPSLTEHGDDGDFLATKTAIDTLQQAFDTHVHPTGVGPSGTTTPVGPLDSTEKFKSE